MITVLACADHDSSKACYCYCYCLACPTRVKTVVADLGKTSNNFRQMSTKALEAVAEALLPRFRPLLDEVAGVSQAGGSGPWRL